MYPFALFVWTALEAGCAARAARVAEEEEKAAWAAIAPPVSSIFPSVVKGASRAPLRCRVDLQCWSGSPSAALLLLLPATGCALLGLGSTSALGGTFLGPARGIARQGAGVSSATDSELPVHVPLQGAGDSKATSLPHVSGGSSAAAAIRLAGLEGLAAAVLGCVAISRRRRWQQSWLRRGSSSRGIGVAAKAVPAAPASCQEVAPRHIAPPPTEISLWHDVELHVKTWLDESTALFHYVNEMPMGTLQKFEVQPHVPQNAIQEDPKGSKKLAAFGRPVPFNYGCFPRTFRDPELKDELYGAPGDDDPLDVLDLGDAPASVGAVVRCLPLGAVCLIDEGQADWKVLVVNVDGKGPLAGARSIADVERLSPGRVEECLHWIDDFKQSGGGGGDKATLHFKVHDIARALSLIEGDHTSWRRLVEEAGPGGIARGHWIRAPQSELEGSMPRPQVLRLGFNPLCAVPGQAVPAKASLVAMAHHTK